MTPTRIARPVAVIAAALALSACGGSGGETGTFESWALKVADIPTSAKASLDAPHATSGVTATAHGLRPMRDASAAPPVRVQVMDLHDFWDARDAGLRGIVQAAAPAVAEVAAPAIVRAATQQAVAAAPALAARTQDAARATIQLGAYSSEAAARAAWAAVSSGEAASALSGLTPLFQPVQVDGRTLVRLRVAASSQSAAAICQAAKVADPWCRAHA